MCDVRDFTFVMIPTTNGETKLHIGYMEKDSMKELTFETAQVWLKDVNEGLNEGKSVESLVQAFKDDWWDGQFFGEDGSVRNYWNEKGYSVDYESLERAGQELMHALRAFAEGARVFFKNGDELPSGWRMIQA